MGLIRGTVNLGKYWGDVTRQGMTQFQLDEDMDLTQEDTQVSSQGKQLRQLTIVFPPYREGLCGQIVLYLFAEFLVL